MRALLWILLLAATALAVWLSSRDGLGLVVPDGGVDDASVAAAARASHVLSEGADSALDHPVVRDGVSPADGADLTELQVVAFDTRAPISGAVVHYEPASLDRDRLTEPELALRAGDLEAFLEQLGASVVTDAEGHCRVPAADRAISVCARHGADLGFLRLVDGGPRVIELRPDRTLVVHVTDHAGRPAAGAAVEFRPLEGDVQHARILAVTDAEGMAEARHVQGLARSALRFPVTLRASVPGAASAPVEIDLVAPPREVRLTLPLTGSVSVRLLEPDGRPVDVRYLADRSVQLFAIVGTSIGAAVTTGFVGCTSAIDENGVAEFAHVGLGREFRARSQVMARHVEFRGPIGPGQHVDIQWHRAGGGVVLTAQLIGTDAEPLRTQRIRIGCRTPSTSIEWLAATDEEGRMRHHAADFPLDEEVTLTVHTEATTAAEASGAELPARSFAAGPEDLGVIELVPPHVILAGRLIVDPALAEENLRLEVSALAGEEWTEVRQVFEDRSPDGAFGIRGFVPLGAPVRLEIATRAFLPVTPLEAAAGTDDLEIELVAAGQVQATVHCGSSQIARGLTCRLQRVDAEHSESGRPARRGADFVTWRWAALSPGVYRLAVRWPGVPEPLHVVDDIEVGAGDCRDPRLEAIDVSTALRTAEVLVRDAAGRPIPDHGCYLLARRDDGSFGSHPVQQGRVTLVFRDPMEVMVVAAGHRATELGRVSEDREVTLEAAAEHSIEVDASMRLPAGVTLALQLVPELGRTDRRVHPNRGPLRSLADYLTETADVEHGVARVAVRHDGSHQVRALVRRGSDRRVVELVEPSTVRLDTSASAAPIRVRIDADALRAALAEIGAGSGR